MLLPFGMSEDIPKRHWPLVTIALVIVNILVFVHEMALLAGGGEPALGAFINQYAVIPASLNGLWDISIITSTFLHAGFLLIASNVLFLLPLGDNVEDRLGHLGYLVFYLVCGYVASLAQILANPALAVPLMGASGAIAGVLAAYLVLSPAGTVRGMLLLGFWFMTQLLSGAAYVTDIAGFVAGTVIALILRQWARSWA